MTTTDPRFDQFLTLLKLAATQHRKMKSLIGVPILKERSEKFSLYISYPMEECIREKVPGTSNYFWDIPEYTNGTTRHAQCLFLLPSHSVHDGAYPYCVQGTEEVEKRYLGSELYDREKILMSEIFDGINLIEVVWSFDYAQPAKEGAWFYHISDFWFGIKKNGVLIVKEKEIKNLININI